MSPETVSTYFHHLRTFFNWLVGEEYLMVSPMDKIAPPVSRPDQIKPFTPQQVNALLSATAKTSVTSRLCRGLSSDLMTPRALLKTRFARN